MMNNELENYIKEFVIDQLINSQIGEKLQQAMHIFKEMQNQLYVLSEKDEDTKSIFIKAGTVLTFAMLKKIADGKMPGSFDKKDWQELANSVSKYAVFQDNQNYTKFVFGMYESYIRSSANYLGGNVSDDVVCAIQYLADEISQKTVLLDDGKITEVQYIDDCLWISLEAMIKLLAAMTMCLGNKEIGEFSQAFAMYAFEYGRLKLLKREQELVNHFIQSQKELSEELEKQYSAYMEALNKEAKQFYVLIDNAFVPEFREMFLHSIVLAKASGVREEEILSTIDDIDSFFLD